MFLTDLKHDFTADIVQLFAKNNQFLLRWVQSPLSNSLSIVNYVINYIATPNTGGDIPIDVPTNQNIGGDTSSAGLTPMSKNQTSSLFLTIIAKFGVLCLQQMD